MISAADLAAMRATQQDAMPSTCSVVRRSLVADTLGGYTETWTTLASAVACRLSALSGFGTMGNPSEVEVRNRFAGRELRQLTLAWNQDITTDDRVVVSSITYEVAALNSAGAWETAQRAVVARVV